MSRGPVYRNYDELCLTGNNGKVFAVAENVKASIDWFCGSESIIIISIEKITFPTEIFSIFPVVLFPLSLRDPEGEKSKRSKDFSTPLELFNCTEKIVIIGKDSKLEFAMKNFNWFPIVGFLPK